MTKLDCVSYAPFRGDQTPLNQELIVDPAQIREDLVEIAQLSDAQLDAEEMAEGAATSKLLLVEPGEGLLHRPRRPRQARQ